MKDINESVLKILSKFYYTDDGKNKFIIINGKHMPHIDLLNNFYLYIIKELD